MQSVRDKGIGDNMNIHYHKAQILDKIKVNKEQVDTTVKVINYLTKTLGDKK